MQTYIGPFILARKFPRFRDSRARTAYAGERIAPLFSVTISCPVRMRKRETPSDRRENGVRRRFFSGWSDLLVKFCVRTDCNSDGRRLFADLVISTPVRGNPGREKAAPGDEPECGGRPVRAAGRGGGVMSVRSAHFGMRNSGIGICMPSYMFIYCAKSR